MRNAEHHEKRGLTEPRNGIGFAELWLALELKALKGARSRHLIPNHNVGEHQPKEITRHGARWDKKSSRRMRQCEGGGEWKTHRGSEASVQMR